MSKKILGSTYLHLNNGGITFSICDEGHGPVIEVRSSHFGNIVHTLSVNTDMESIKQLCTMFYLAIEEGFSEPRPWCLAKVLNESGVDMGGSTDEKKDAGI